MNRSDQVWLGAGILAALFGTYSAVQGDWRVVGVFVLGLFGITGLWLAFRTLKSPLWLQAGAALLVLSAWILGDFFTFYSRYWWWDLALHGTAGVLLALISYDWLSTRLTVKQALIVAFLVTLGAGAVWEIWEFAWGVTPHDMSVLDTITDLIVKMVGALAALLSSFWRTRTRR